MDLPPGTTTLMSSFVTHVWVARDMASNTPVAMFVVAKKTADDSGASKHSDNTQRFVVTDASAAHPAFAVVADRRPGKPPPAPAEAEIEEGEDRNGEVGGHDLQKEKETRRGDDDAKVVDAKGEL